MPLFWSKPKEVEEVETDDEFHDFMLDEDSSTIKEQRCYFCGRTPEDPIHHMGIMPKQDGDSSSEEEECDPKNPDIKWKVKADHGDVYDFGARFSGGDKIKTLVDGSKAFPGPRPLRGEFVTKEMAKYIPELRNVVQIHCMGPKGESIFAQTASGQLFAWGNNAHGMLGLGGGGAVKEPTFMKSMKGKCMRKLTVGKMHAAILTDRYEVYTWGVGASLGHGPYGKKSQVLSLSSSLLLPPLCLPSTDKARTTRRMSRQRWSSLCCASATRRTSRSSCTSPRRRRWM